MNRKQIKREITIKTNYLLTNLNKMSMKKVYLILAAAVGMTITSCTTNDYLGDVNNDQAINDGSIKFGLKFQNMTRADIAGQEAADKLGNNFYVMGTKGTEPATSPTTDVVFDNYLVHFGINTAGTTESNTANWEYVGVTPGIGSYANYVKLGTYGSQTIKYWDYSQDQYDFLAFSTGSFKAVSGSSTAANEIGVTKIATGTDLATAAYTFDIPSPAALAETYITDITEVKKAKYGKEVTLQFKNIGSKVRVALYETVPGYAVKDVIFYQIDGTNDFTDANKGTKAKLISADTYGFPQDAAVTVKFPHIGVNHSPEATTPNTPKADYDKASVTVTPVTGSSQKWETFDELHNFASTKEATSLADGNYIGRTLPTATYAGDAYAKYYKSVFPVSTPSPITLRLDYTLVSIDGSGEEINVYGAKAVVPSTYTKWLPNYAYTYIFKISDNTNGWTNPDGTNPAGLFPITFDAVVAEAIDANAEQTTITTVAAPTITTYQQNHNPNKNGDRIATDEYSKATAKNIYVQVMDNSTATATLKGDLNGTTPTDDTKRSLLYAVTGTTPASEALVMDALENQASVNGSGVITGRNGVVLTPAEIDATVTSIENGVDDNPIGVTAGQAAKIAYTLDAGTYAYVYDYTTAAGGKNKTDIYQPITVTPPSAIGASGVMFSSVAITTLNDIDTSVAANVTADDEDVDDDFIYFTKTKNGTSSWTYSFVSVDGKKKLPAGLVKCAVSKLTANIDGATPAAADTFYFTKYVRNDGKYAVKVIKLI